MLRTVLLREGSLRGGGFRPKRCDFALCALGSLIVMLVSVTIWANFRVAIPNESKATFSSYHPSAVSPKESDSDDDFLNVESKITKIENSKREIKIAPAGFDYNVYLTKLNEKQKQYCGALCSYDAVELRKKKNLGISVEFLQKNMVKRPIVCQDLFSTRAQRLFDSGAPQYPPPERLPPPLVEDCTLGKNVKTIRQFLTTPSLSSAMQADWSRAYIDDITTRLLAGENVIGGYGVNATKSFFDFLMLRTRIKDQHVLIVGSEKPWVEAMCLAAGAREITTLEYRPIRTNHRKITTYTPTVFNELYRAGNLPLFDVAVTFSSIEHSGLGRYGDGFNCFGDIISVARLSCVVKKGGHLIMGVPAREEGHHDILLYNSARNYGSVRWPLLLTNWLAIDYHRQGRPWFHGIVYALNMRE